MEFDVMTRATTWDNVAALARRVEAAGFQWGHGSGDGSLPQACRPRADEARGDADKHDRQNGER